MLSGNVPIANVMLSLTNPMTGQHDTVAIWMPGGLQGTDTMKTNSLDLTLRQNIRWASGLLISPGRSVIRWLCLPGASRARSTIIVMRLNFRACYSEAVRPNCNGLRH